MKLLAIGLRSDPETFLVRLLGGLVDQGVGVQIGTPERPKSLLARSQGIRWKRVPSQSGSKGPRLLSVVLAFVEAFSKFPRETIETVKRSKKEATVRSRLVALSKVLPLVGTDCDIVYFPWILGVGALPEWFECRIPIVSSVRGGQVNIKPLTSDNLTETKRILSRAFEKSRAVHCVSAEIFSTSVRLGLDPMKAQLIRPAVDPHFFSPMASKRKSEDALKLVSVGSMIWRKGYEYLLMAMKALTTTDLRYFLTIIGDGPELDRVEFCIRDLGLGDCVNLVGSASPECVRETLRESDVFVLSSLSEGISNAVLEAMACGLPVVTTDCGGMSEVVADGVEGFVVPVRDPISMSKAIRRLAVNSKLRVAMGGRGRQRVVAQYSLDGHVNSWMELLHRIDGTDRQEMNTS